MSRAKNQIDPKIAAIRSSGRQLSALGTRVGRQVIIVGGEGARRTGSAWTVMRYGPPPSRRRTRNILLGAVVAAGAIGAVTVLAVQRLLGTWTEDNPTPPHDLNTVAPTPESATQSGASRSL